MCGRYYIPVNDDEAAFEAIIDQLQHLYGSTDTFHNMRRGEVYPTNIAPVITAEAPALMKWGFSRYDGKGQIINARVESAAEKPMFKHAYSAGRCLIPASYYFEWRKDGKARFKYAIGHSEPIFMAGLYRREKDSSLPVFVIMTRPAAPGIAFIHDRMPVIVPASAQAMWLAEPIPPQALNDVSDEQVTFHEVG